MPEPSDSRQNDVDHEEREAEVNRTLFIRSLPDRTTEDELYELFLQVSLEHEDGSHWDLAGMSSCSNTPH